MLSTKHVITDIKQVPITWIFEYYLNLSERLHGQQVKLLSVFKHERTPSMTLWYDHSKREYRFKDFSSGEGGSAYDLVSKLYNISFKAAISRIMEDYSKAKASGIDSAVEINPQKSYTVESFETRNWIDNDAKYWSQYGISRRQLERYNVKPLKSYRMNNGDKTLDFAPSIITYGYFSMTGTLYKIYSPKNPKRKFFKVADHVQGIEQLKYESDILVICSSLKDAMCLDAMGFKLEVIAPDSENTVIKPMYVDVLKRKYKKIITLFDNDEAGIKAIERYKTELGINGCFYPTAKDVSDAVARDGQESVKNTLERILSATINV
jgi:mannose/fructose/N-acetylgalactosamine-specific phosphotransferase system component IIB